MGLKDFLFGKKEEMQQQQMYTPEQQQYFNMLLQGSQPGMQSGMEYLTQMLSGDPQAMEAFEAPMMRQFQEQTIPGLAEQFAGVDAQGSSAFGQALGQAGAGLQENLASLRQGLKMQALQQMQGLGGMGLGQQFENITRPQTGGLFGGMAGGLGKGLGQSLPGGIGDMWSKFSGMFSKTPASK